MALDEKTVGSVTTHDGSAGIDGYTDVLGNFSLRLLRNSGEVQQMSHLTTRVSGLDKIKDVTEHSLHAVRSSMTVCRFRIKVVLSDLINIFGFHRFGIQELQREPLFFLGIDCMVLMTIPTQFQTLVFKKSMPKFLLNLKLFINQEPLG